MIGHPTRGILAAAVGVTLAAVPAVQASASPRAPAQVETQVETQARGATASASAGYVQLFANHASSWYKSADESVWARDSVVSRYTVERYGRAVGWRSFGGTNKVFDTVLAAHSCGGALVLREGSPRPHLRRVTLSGALIRRYDSGYEIVDADLNCRTGLLVTLERQPSLPRSYVVVRQRLDGTGRRVLSRVNAHRPAPTPGLVLSPGGAAAYVVYSLSNELGRIYSIRTADAARRVVRNLYSAEFTELDVSPNGRYLLVTATNHITAGVRHQPIRIPVGSGPSARLPLTGRTARYGPDGGQIYVTQPGAMNDSEIGELSWSNGTLKRMVVRSGQIRSVPGVTIDVHGQNLAVLRP